MYGATVPNALQALAKLAYSFHDADGRVAIEGFYDDVVELSPEERAELAAHPQSEAELLEEAGVSAAWGEPGLLRQGAAGGQADDRLQRHLGRVPGARARKP